MKTTPLIIGGALGRMGRACVELALRSAAFAIKNGTSRAGSGAQKPDHWPCDITSLPHFDGPAVLVDFSHPSMLKPHLSVAKNKGWPILVGTTGHDPSNLALMKSAAQHQAVLYAPNTSMMANLLITFSKACARIPKLSAHILDVHHEGKVDAPSGTALAIKSALVANMAPEKIMINSLRVSNIVGEHVVSFYKENESLELSHRVYDRRIFAEGALIAAQFLYGRGPGLYDMSDVLNLK